MSSFKFDEKALSKVAQAAVADVAKDAQKKLDRVYRQHKGAPLSVVESALRRALSSTAMQPDRAQLRDWAQLISKGTQIEFRTD